MRRNLVLNKVTQAPHFLCLLVLTNICPVHSNLQVILLFKKEQSFWTLKPEGYTYVSEVDDGDIIIINESICIQKTDDRSGTSVVADNKVVLKHL